MQPVDHLLAAREALLVQKREIERAVHGLDTLIDGLRSPAPDAAPLVADSPAAEPASPAAPASTLTMRDVIDKKMPRGKPMHLREIAALMAENGVDVAEHSVRGQLHKFASKGVLKKAAAPATFVYPETETQPDTIQFTQDYDPSATGGG